MTTLYRVDDPNLLTSVLSGEGVHLEPDAILDGLTADQAHAKPHGLPHSIAEIVAHICYWQEWFNKCAVVGFSGIAEHAVDGWPAVPPDGWDALRTRYLHSVAEAKRIAAESDSLGNPVTCQRGSTFPALPTSRAALESCMRQCTAAIIWARSLRFVSCWVSGHRRPGPSRGRGAGTRVWSHSPLTLGPRSLPFWQAVRPLTTGC